MKTSIYVTYGDAAAAMTLALLEAAELAARIPAGAPVALKPNLVTDSPAEQGATTHPELLEALISYLRDSNIRDICIMESAWVGCNTAAAYRRCGYEAISKRFDVPLYDLKRDSAVEVQSPIGKLRVCRRPLEAGYLINLPVLKGHCQTVMTCALKNMKGCIPDSEKRRYHSMGLHKPIAALASVLKPHLTIVDSICGDLNFEEGGTPVLTNRMYMGTDPVQLDAFGCGLMGIDVKQVPYIGLAEQYGAGKAAYAPEDIRTIGDASLGGSYPAPTGKVARLTKNVRQDSACSACFGSLVHALYRMGRAPDGPIYIGQGYRGKELDGIGIGDCCRGAARCARGCPPTAEEIRRAIEN